MNQSGHLVRKSYIIAFGLKMKIGLVKAGDAKCSVPVHQIPIEKGEPPRAPSWPTSSKAWLAPRQPKVGAALGARAPSRSRSQITEQISAKEMTGEPSLWLPAARTAGRSSPDLLVIAGEHSGDEHAARLVAGLLAARCRDLSIAALGGPRLAAAGAPSSSTGHGVSVVGFAAGG